MASQVANECQKYFLNCLVATNRKVLLKAVEERQTCLLVSWVVMLQNETQKCQVDAEPQIDLLHYCEPIARQKHFKGLQAVVGFQIYLC